MPTTSHLQQTAFQFIEHRLEQTVVQQRSMDGYINATALCKVANKHWHNYVRNESTGQFLRALAAETRIRVSELNQQVRDENGQVSTWVHPRVAIHLAQWLSAEFAVKVTDWVHRWMSGEGPAQAKRAEGLPPHIQRHILNVGKVPLTHFSILQELTNMLIAPMEAHGYTLPERFVPDISQGRMFCKFARDELGLDTDDLPTYDHEYPDGRRVQAKLYPVEHLGHFRKFINEKWIPERAAAYFAERDSAALPALERVLRIAHMVPPKLSAPAPKANGRLPAPVAR